MDNNGAPIPPEGSQAAAEQAAARAAAERAARQEAADAAYGRAQSGDVDSAAATAPQQPAQAVGTNPGQTAPQQPAQAGDVNAARQAEAQAKAARKQMEAQQKAQAKAQKKAAKQAKKAAKGGVGAGGAFLAGAGGALVVVIIAALVFAFTPLNSLIRGTSTVQTSSGTYNITTSEDATISEAVAANCIPSAVTIYVYGASDYWSQYFQSSSSASSSPTALGSGVIIQSDDDISYIVTNYHVIEDSTKLTVTLQNTDSNTYEATVVGYDDAVDLAVISIPVGDLPVMEWGDSDSLVVGEWCMAIGTPMGYEDTCTTGIISATGRSDAISDGDTTYYQSDVIQTDASINPGNSGGALVNAEGKLIGIVEYLSSYSSASAGLGFAIPQSTAQEVVETLISGETPQHAFFGIVMTNADNGVTVYSVVKDSSADKAGLVAGDVITEFDGQAATSSTVISAAVAAHDPGDEIKVTITRDGQEKELTVTLGSSSDNTGEYSSQLEDQSGQGEQDYDYGYGNGYGNSGNGNGYGFDWGDLFNYFNN